MLLVIGKRNRQPYHPCFEKFVGCFLKQASKSSPMSACMPARFPAVATETLRYFIPLFLDVLFQDLHQNITLVQIYQFACLLSIVLGMRLCETGFDNPDFTHMQNYI
jgi:hypothetical protein